MVPALDRARSLVPLPCRVTVASLSRQPRLIVLAGGDRRMETLVAALMQSGYDAVSARSGEELDRLIAALGPPEALLVAAPVGTNPSPEMALARRWLARLPQLVVVYLAFLPAAPRLPLQPREQRLPAPCTAATLAAALAAAGVTTGASGTDASVTAAPVPASG